MRGLGWFKYLITLLIVVLAALGQYLLWPLIGDAPFLLFYPAVILAALYGNGILAICLSAMIVQYYFIPPEGSFAVLIPGDLARLTVFVASAFMIQLLTVRLARARLEARSAESRISLTYKYAQDQRTEQAFRDLQDSEARMRSVLDNALDAVVGMDSDGIVSQWNPQAENIFGFSRDEAIGRRMSELIIPHAYRQAHEAGLMHYLSSGQARMLNKRVQITALDRGGREFPIELTITPIRSGAKLSFAAFIRDISERQRIEKDLLIKSDVLENSLNGFDIVDEDGKFIYANRAYLKMWGYERLEQVIGTSATGHCADPSTPAQIIAELKSRGECNIEFVARRKDGSTFDVHMWARLAHGPGGKEIYPSTSVDITERKRAEEALRRAVQTRDEFISICSHELKTPITSMKLQFQMAERQLKRGDPRVFSEELVSKRIVSTNRQLDRMTRLIEEMLDVTRFTQGRLRLDLQVNDLSALLAEMADRFAEQFFQVGAALNLDLEPAVRVEFDRYRIEQVVSNLLTNAIKYGSRNPVEVSLRRTGDHAQLRVTDHGVGIREDSLDRIFNRFERAISANNISGLGLGLYISRQIVTAHGGKIWAESKPGEGSTFVMELPLRQRAASSQGF